MNLTKGTKMDEQDSVNEIDSAHNSQTENDNISPYSDLTEHNTTDHCVISDYITLSI